MDFVAIGSLAAGVVLLILGAGGVVEGGVALARRMGVSSMLVGLTIVALGTSAPEFAVGIQGSLRGANDVVLGNVIGSNIMNILVVLGLSALIQPVAVRVTTIRRDIPFVTMASLGTLFLVLDGEVARGDGLLLLMTGIAFTWHIYHADRIGQAAADVEEASGLLVGRPLVLSLVAVAGGIAFLVWGGELMVTGGMSVARDLGVTERTIGLTVVAIGTSLPELATVLVAAFRRQVDLAVGNLVGSNVFNLLVVLGSAAAVHPLSVSATIVHIDIPIMLGVSVLLLRLAKAGMKIDRRGGAILLGTYAAYLVVILGGYLPT